MKALLAGLVGMAVFIGSSVITFANEWGGYSVKPGIKALPTDIMKMKNDWWDNNKGWKDKWWDKKWDKYNHRGSVPIPGTLPLFGAGFAGFAAWHWRQKRRRRKRMRH